jgi:hypothetical protein
VLETLLRKLPNPTTPAPPSADRPKPGQARQLDANQIHALIQGCQTGVTISRTCLAPLAPRFVFDVRATAHDRQISSLVWQVGGGVWCGLVLQWGLGLWGRLVLVRSCLLSTSRSQ